MSKWVGYAVSVRCGSPLGCYQGTITAADGVSVTLTKAFRNGFPYPKAQVTLNAADIKSLSIIEAATEGDEVQSEPRHGGNEPHSGGTESRSCRRRHHKATVCESLQATRNNTAGSESGGGGGGHTAHDGDGGGSAGRTRPLHAGGGPGRERGGGGGALRGRNALAFGAGSPPLEEFDFQTNLALFDKRAVGAALAARPDVVPAIRDYRHDQNVLGAPPPPQPITLQPAAGGGGGYVSDAGVRVPALNVAARERIWTALERHRLLNGALLLLARAAADISLRLLGGARRLEPRNAHQSPRCAVLAGPHRAGRVALMAARLLAAHGVNVACYVEPSPASSDVLSRELAALQVAAVPVLSSAGRLDTSADCVVLGVQHEAALLQWASAARGAVLAIEPPIGGWSTLIPRAALQALLPLWPPPPCGRLQLCDVSPPAALLAPLGIHYSSPFGAATLIALHPADD